MSATESSDASRAALRAALQDVNVIDRYRAKIHSEKVNGCTWWVGALTAKGHGRFWVGPDPSRSRAGFVVIAHRFGYGLAYGIDALERAPLLAHAVCDNPMCQDPTHLRPSTIAENSADWAIRRHRLGGHLRDRRGARGRAEAIRQALRDGLDPYDVLQAGIPNVERDQLPLW